MAASGSIFFTERIIEMFLNTFCNFDSCTSSKWKCKIIRIYFLHCIASHINNKCHKWMLCTQSTERDKCEVIWSHHIDLFYLPLPPILLLISCSLAICITRSPYFSLSLLYSIHSTWLNKTHFKRPISAVTIWANINWMLLLFKLDLKHLREIESESERISYSGRRCYVHRTIT